MINVVFFHDSNWRIRGYKVEFGDTDLHKADRVTVVANVLGLLVGTKLALKELKAYHCKNDSDELYEVTLLRVNKNTAAVLKPLELGVKQFATTFPHIIKVKQF